MFFFFKAKTAAYPAVQQGAAGVSIWIIIGAVLAGLLLLVILVVVLWRLGFFKRNRISDPTLSGNLTKQGESETLLNKWRAVVVECLGRIFEIDSCRGSRVFLFIWGSGWIRRVRAGFWRPRCDGSCTYTILFKLTWCYLYRCDDESCWMTWAVV